MTAEIDESERATAEALEEIDVEAPDEPNQALAEEILDSEIEDVIKLVEIASNVG
ncbi:hypothetical protein BDZ89DRAFT_1077700 [Hymenopellis radicata]|nr:hypothetical protein BDZ89DRAFT_1077700 [Hymenopellis radicata]